jgi:hypothetical protein
MLSAFLSLWQPVTRRLPQREGDVKRTEQGGAWLDIPLPLWHQTLSPVAIETEKRKGKTACWGTKL